VANAIQAWCIAEVRASGAASPIRPRHDDWAAAALDAIARGGLAAVAVEPLARELGVTKGSFYWHFDSRDDLVAAAIARWERLHVAAVPTASDGDLEAQLAAIVADAVAFATKRSVHAQLIHETGDPRVAAALARVTTDRLKRLTALYRDAGLTATTARARAATSYAAVLGLSLLNDQAALEGSTPAALERALLAAIRP
jgi:AcrR family transcriptional regulator